MDRRQFLSGLAATATPGLLTAGQALRASAAQNSIASTAPSEYLERSNGWYTQNGKAIWGYAQQNQTWGGYRGAPTDWWTEFELSPSLICNEPGKIGLNHTEDLDRLSDSMLHYGYAGFEHTPPLWFDRRRNAHDTIKHPDGNFVGPVLEMPWAGSGQRQAWDGLPLYARVK